VCFGFAGDYAATSHAWNRATLERVRLPRLALHGHEAVPSEGQVEFPLVPHRKDPKRVEAVTPHVRLRAGTRTHAAVTRYRPLHSLRAADGAEYTLVEVDLESAFRHQIRVHLATIGHPLLGDAIYRGPMAPPEITLARHFLHATEVRFPHPSTGSEVHVVSPLPDDLAEALAKLGG
jgi:23S rRNA pseudouridine1911/1915/1917 synthase